jgi:DNA polymerase-1
VAGKFIIIDGNSLLFRAYHALPALSSRSGQPTGALLGFADMLLNLLAQEQPEAAALVFDAPGPTFRHQRYPAYKATRPPTPPDLVQQIGLAHELAEAMGLHLFEVAGVEADDVIATLARRAREAGYEVLIVSGDRDLVQIVQPGIQVLVSLRGFSSTRLYDEARVREEYGVAPAQIAELKGLAGDPSDNLPGAPGVGPKTAQRLLQQYGSLANLYAHLEEIEPPRLAANLQASRALVELGAQLAKIKDDVELPAAPQDCRWEGLRVADLRRLFIALDFNKLLPKLPAAGEEEQAPTELAREAEQVRRFAQQAGPQLAVAVAQLHGRAVGVALATAQRALYVPLGGGEAEGLFAALGRQDLRAALAEVLASEHLAKIGCHFKAELAALEAVGLELRGMAFDVALAAYLLAPDRAERAVDTLAAKELGWQLPPAEVADCEAAAEALGKRARATWQLRHKLEPQLEAHGAGELFREVEMPLIAILRAMERAGIAVDRQRLRELGAALDELRASLQEQIYQIAGHPFNLDSPKQLAQVLFEQLRLPTTKRTKTGLSTSAAVLEELAEQHEIARLVLQYREYAKLRSTYVDGLLRQADAQGRVHTTFEQMGTATGRLSSRNPNLQNIPVRTEWGRRIRACFVAPADDWALVSADYSQIELRLLAHLSGDPQLRQAFERGEDIHAHTASLIFHVPPEQVSADMRRVAKTVNFAVIYGMGPASLARQIGVSRRAAEEFIANYFQRLPKVREYLERTLAEARQRLWVSTIFGRRRPLPELASSEERVRSYAERAAINAPIQGSAADLIKIAMVRLAQTLPTYAPQARLLLQVHDELVWEAPRAQLADLAPVVKEVMESAAQLEVPLKVEVKAGPNWRDLEPL